MNFKGDGNHYFSIPTHLQTYYSKEYLDKIDELNEVFVDTNHKLKQSICKLFNIDLSKWFELEFLFTYKLNINPIVLDEMEYYRVDYLFNNYKEWLNKEKEMQNKQDGKQGQSLTQKEMMQNNKNTLGDYTKGFNSTLAQNLKDFKFNPSSMSSLTKGFKI